MGGCTIAPLYHQTMTSSRYWQDRVVARSLERAAASPGDRRSRESVARRALKPATKMVAAGTELLEETSSSSFTVQDVVARADTSLQTFYRHFSTKDELLLAVLEEVVSTGTEVYRVRARRNRDPVAQLEIVVKGPFRASRSVGQARLIVREHLRLVENYPDEVRLADLPFKDLVADVIRAAQAIGRFPGIAADDEAELISDFVRVRFHGMTLGTARWSRAAEAEMVWKFCLGGLSRNELAADQQATGDVTSISWSSRPGLPTTRAVRVRG
jgi:TetR/AcrR family transcriptional regulator